MKKGILKNKVVIYQAKSGAIELRGDFAKETIWATQAQIAELFDVTPQNITLHLANIYKDRELEMVATCKDSLQVQNEGTRKIKRTIKFYNLDAVIAVGYRISSVTGTNFRIWATKTLRAHIVDGYTINRARIGKNYENFMKAVEHMRDLLPASGVMDAKSTLDLVKIFAETWVSIDSYDKDTLPTSGVSNKQVKITIEELLSSLFEFRAELSKNTETSDLFGHERQHGSVAGIVGNVFQSFGGKDLYSTIQSA